MRRRSLTRQRQDRKDKPKLSTFAEQNPFCWRCGQTYRVETHHIAGRTHRQRHNRANLCRLCRECHAAFHDHRAGLVEALALKLRFDPAHYDRLLVLAIQGRGPRFVEESEVEELAAQLSSRIAI